ncbi:hypothetical protein [Endothiovibrio diazotrophicus]
MMEPALPLRPHPGRREVLSLGAVLLAAWVALTALYGVLGYLDDLDNRVRGADSVYYYIYLPSLFEDGDLDLANNLRDVYGPDFQPELLPNGRARNVFSVGPALFWSPFYLLAKGAAALGLDGGLQVTRLAVYLSNSLYGLLGLWLCGILALHFVALRPALIATLGLFWASQETYYLWSFTAMSHNVSLFAAALFLLAWVRWGVRPWVGVAAGAMILARWQNALLLLPAMAVALGPLLRGGEPPMAWLRRHLPFVVALLATLLPQFIAWQLIYDRPLLIPQGGGFIDFGDLPLGGLLFGTRHGLFSWHPLLLAALLGLALLWRPRRLLLLGIVAALAAQTLLNAAVSDWWAGWSFGQRRFISLLPLFGVGLALALAWLETRLPPRRAAAGAALLVALLGGWNLLFVHQYQEALIFRSLPLTWGEMTIDKFRLSRVSEARDLAQRATQTMGQDLAAAERLADRAYRLAPDQPISAPVYAFVLLVNGKDREAIEPLRALLARHPDYPFLRWGLAHALARSGAGDEALALLRAAPAAPWRERAEQRLTSGAPSLLDDDFLGLYNGFLRHLTLE